MASELGVRESRDQKEFMASSAAVIVISDSDDEEYSVPSVQGLGSTAHDAIVLSDGEDAVAEPAQGSEKKRPRDEPGSSTAPDCPVCIDTLGSNGAVRALGCVHVYCAGCIRQHITTQLEQQRAPACPVCKRVIPPEEQRACGVDPHEASGGGAHAAFVSINMFAPDDERPGAIAAHMAALSAAFPHASARDVRHNRNPMRLLDHHMDRQRRQRRTDNDDASPAREDSSAVAGRSATAGSRGPPARGTTRAPEGREPVRWP